MARNWYHEALMDSYYCAREAQEREAEAYSIGYQTELEEFYKVNRRVTFREWLVEFPKTMGYQYADAA